ncbi:uncharacterized protein LOC141697580 [Apium graveolens]|uniref:uncharacterized protein LOC141697580 n=1 Tax=Apium graveolens TaxID=4045 RepID=UPI003D7AED56
MQEIPQETWMTPIHNYIRAETLLENKLQARYLCYQAAKYVEYDGVLYKRGFNQPLLRCVDLEEGNYIHREVHEGRESPFMLTYGYEAKISVEVGVGSLRRDLFVEEDAEVNQRLHLDLLDEARMNSQLKRVAYQQRIVRYFNKKVKYVPYKVGDLVLRKVIPNTKIAQHGVLGANWEGPYRDKVILWKGTYCLEDLDVKLIPRAWNAEHL